MRTELHPHHLTLITIALTLILGAAHAQPLSENYDRVCVGTSMLFIDGELHPRYNNNAWFHFAFANTFYDVPHSIGGLCDGERDYNATASIVVTTEEDGFNIIYNLHGRIDESIYDRLMTLYGDPTSSEEERQTVRDYLLTIGRSTRTGFYPGDTLREALDNGWEDFSAEWEGLLWWWNNER